MQQHEKVAVPAEPERHFVRCDNHPSQGGPHVSRGVFVGWIGAKHQAEVWACTHRSKRGKVCGSVQVAVPSEAGFGMTRAQSRFNHFVVVPQLVAEATRKEAS